ncbi:DUF461 domain-containing protein [Streptomyces sp. WAC01280]|uniref:DUF461 domain-containing protein n=1 Tax=Streptomyces sp. WAC01280 TaxID=2487424 RepID=UPI000F7AB73A|nr:DUF461 domain-containing protein [Streptomyces sp. WAC01280]RSS50305.1 DUF461 domain-containing protein [Streptomyces sp. WAC01280]
MSRSLRRGALAATAIVFSIAALSACGAGNDAQTLGVKPDNAAVTVDDVKIQNALVITQPHQGVKGPAVVSATVFNNGTTPQTLEAITLPGTTATVKLTPAAGGAGPITVPALGSVVIGGAGNATAVIENGTEAAKNGNAQKVVFKLSKTGNVGLSAFVVPATSYFKDFGPSIVPAPPGSSPTASAPAEGEHGGGEGEHGTEPSGEATTAGH